MKQMELSDFFPSQLSLGWIKDSEVERYKGEIIPFAQLINYIGAKVMMECPRESAVSYRVVLVKGYLTDIDKVFRWKDGEAELLGTCDRVRLSDDNRKGKANMWLSEHYCRDGRYCTGKHPERFYTIKE